MNGCTTRPRAVRVAMMLSATVVLPAPEVGAAMTIPGVNDRENSILDAKVIKS